MFVCNRTYDDNVRPDAPSPTLNRFTEDFQNYTPRYSNNNDRQFPYQQHQAECELSSNPRVYLWVQRLLATEWSTAVVRSLNGRRVR